MLPLVSRFPDIEFAAGWCRWPNVLVACFKFKGAEGVNARLVLKEHDHGMPHYQKGQRELTSIPLSGLPTT